MGLGARCPGPPARRWAEPAPLLSWGCPRRRDQISAVGCGGCWGESWGLGGLGWVLCASGAATPPRCGLSIQSGISMRQRAPGKGAVVGRLPFTSVHHTSIPGPPRTWPTASSPTNSEARLLFQGPWGLWTGHPEPRRRGAGCAAHLCMSVGVHMAFQLKAWQELGLERVRGTALLTQGMACTEALRQRGLGMFRETKGDLRAWSTKQGWQGGQGCGQQGLGGWG